MLGMDIHLPCSFGDTVYYRGDLVIQNVNNYHAQLYVDDELIETKSVSGGGKYERSFSAPTSSMTCTCTNGQTCSISHSSGVYYTATINTVTANTTCRVEY